MLRAGASFGTGRHPQRSPKPQQYREWFEPSSEYDGDVTSPPYWVPAERPILGTGATAMDRMDRAARGTDDNSRPAPLDSQQRIIAFLDRTGYPMVQDNGQRRYGPPPSWSGGPPPKGCEVFVGKLPRDVFEDELVPFLERAGTLYEVRLMMDFAGSNRGYAFATYSCREEAKRAVRELNNQEIRPRRQVGVCQSVDNCRLFVGGIPRDKTREEVLEEMRRVTENVVDVILYRHATDKRRNRGFAFVEYSDHKAAAVARRRMIPGRMTLWGSCEVAVDWAQPEPLVDEETMESGLGRRYPRRRHRRKGPRLEQRRSSDASDPPHPEQLWPGQQQRFPPEGTIDKVRPPRSGRLLSTLLCAARER
ncbi:hypothetical protein V5799_015279, partial [Amblyomma americanum]